MANVANIYVFLSTSTLLLLAAAMSAQISNKALCEEEPLDVIILVDTNARSIIDFNKQRNRITDIIRHLENIWTGRDILYGIIAFHRHPVILLSIVSSSASQPEKVMNYINALEISIKFDSSPALALELAAQQFINSSHSTSNKLVILAHDGVSTDLIAQTLEARNSLKHIGATLFAVTSTKTPNIPALIGYTTDREHIYATESDHDIFFEEIGKATGRCQYFSESSNSSTNNTTLQAGVAFGIRTDEAEEENRNEKSSFERKCKANKIDLMIVLDSSGSVFHAFENERKLVHDLIDSLIPVAFENGRVQISVVRFSSSTEIVIPSKINQTRNEIMKELDKIKFTGGGTRIAKAVNLALADLSRWRRNDAIQMFILISDGNGQEFWHVAQMAGKKLQNANVEVFAVPISRDYDLDELVLYTGDAKRVYVGREQNRFVRTISSLINKCLEANLSEFYVTKATKRKPSTATIIGQKKAASNKADLRPPEQSTFKAQGVRLLGNNEQTANLDKDLKTELIMNQAVKKKQIEENTTLKIFPRISNVDLVFAIDLSPRLPTDLRNQLKLMTELINRVTDEDISEQRIRVAIVTFSQEAQINLEWGKATTKAQVLQHFDSIKYVANNSSAVTGIKLTTEYVQKFRRPNTRLVIILVSDGSTNQDPWHSVMQVTRKLHKLQEAVIYAVTTSKQYRFVELETFTGNKWKVYVNGRINRFVTDASKELMEKLEGKNDESVDVSSSPIVKSIQAHNDLVDLIILVDKSVAASNDFQVLKNFLKEMLRNLQAIDSESRIQISLITFADNVHIEIDLKKSATKEDVSYAVEKLQNEYSNSSLSAAVNVALSQISISHKGRRRRVFMIFTDGSSRDSIETMTTTAAKLQQIDAEVFVIPITDNYSKHELLLYAGNQSTLLINIKDYGKKFTNQILLNSDKSVRKDFVEVTNADQFSAGKITATTLRNDQSHVTNQLDLTVKSIMENETRHALFELNSPFAEIKSKAQTGDPSCLVDLVFIVDKSQSVEKTFQKQLQLAIALIKAISSSDFNKRVRVAAISFSSQAQINFQFNEFNDQSKILNALLLLTHSGGNTSSVSGVNLALKEIQERGRKGARKMVVLISDGNSQNRWEDVLDASDRLHAIGAIVYAITPSHDYYFRELELYTRNKWLVYVDAHIKRFMDDATLSLLKCQDPSTSQSLLPSEFEFLTVSPTIENKTLVKEEELVKRESSAVPNRCKYSKMDLEIILDASTSRQEVFEHQRELALSLIERLPIDADQTHVAVGINSFTSTPTLRQTLGLGRNKQMVRHAIEDIKYTGGNTFTAQAVELSVQDLKRGRRADAIQVVVLMNDGMSQDPWEKVLEASQLLRDTGAELFGVALGDNIDLRELKHYIGSQDRIYRDNSTERFLTDVVSLLTGGKNCSMPDSVSLKNTKTYSSNSSNQLCSTPNLDIIILFDNAIKTANMSEQSISSNRYLLLDVLGSLPTTKHSDRVKISVITFNSQPQVVISMDDLQDRDRIFAKVESIKPKASIPCYAKAINFAVQEYNKGHRKDARSIFVIVGDGQSDDNLNERNDAIEHLRNATGLNRYAVDSGKWVDIETLSRYTGSPDNVFNYDRNAEFARLILNAAAAANKARCIRVFLMLSIFISVF
ncbi:Collagen alpha-6(VI) chain [Dirofilaria immitis]